MTDPGSLDIDAIISGAAADRSSTRRRNRLMAWGVSIAVTVIWLVYVSVAGHWPRVGRNWASAVTMVFGSFVAGSTPQGGGAVAFPVFTKLLEIPSNVARTFSLSIQAIGMTAASLSILINRRPVEWRAIRFGAPAAIIGFIFGLYVLGDRNEPFWPSILPGEYVKVTFTIIVAAMAFGVFIGYREQLLERLSTMPPLGPRLVIGLLTCCLLGGVAASLVGSGVDVLVFLFLAVLVGLNPQVAVPTSVLLMTIVSLLGVAILVIGDGQLSIQLNAANNVVAIDGSAVSQAGDGAMFGTGAPLDGARFDLFGLWLAAAPVVAWGAPLGALVASRLRDRQLVSFVVALAAAEVISTAIFLEPLRRDPALLTFAIVGTAFAILGLAWLSRHRQSVMGLPAVDLHSAFDRQRLDATTEYPDQLRDTQDGETS